MIGCAGAWSNRFASQVVVHGLGVVKPSGRLLLYKGRAAAKLKRQKHKRPLVSKWPLNVWLREPDLNRRPSGYEPDELPDCSIPRRQFYSEAPLCQPLISFLSNTYATTKTPGNKKGPLTE